MCLGTVAATSLLAHEVVNVDARLEAPREFGVGQPVVRYLLSHRTSHS